MPFDPNVLQQIKDKFAGLEAAQKTISDAQDALIATQAATDLAQQASQAAEAAVITAQANEEAANQSKAAAVDSANTLFADFRTFIDGIAV